MTAVLFFRRYRTRLGMIIALIAPLHGQQQPPTNNIDLLMDLGIVIEPSSESDVYSRVIARTSEEVDIKIRKVHSGEDDEESYNDLLSAIHRINNRIADLETSFNSELIALQVENSELKDQIAALAEPKLSKPIRPSLDPVNLEPSFEADMVMDELPVFKSIVMLFPKQEMYSIDELYRNGMYAYQSGNFATALKLFADIDFNDADIEQVENVLYWTADAYLQMHEYEQALSSLDKLLKYKQSDMVDDALIKKGLLYKELGDMNLAVNTFKKVVVGHPESEYSLLAELEIKRGEIALQ